MTVDREVVKDMGETNKVFDKNNIALDKFEEERERELRRVRQIKEKIVQEETRKI